jgi:predicted ATPase
MSKTASEDWILYTAVDLLVEVQSSASTVEAASSSSGDGDAEFALLCLQAARKAAKRAAFRSAARYADLGIRHLVERNLKKFDLWLELSNLSAEMHSCRGAFEKSNDTVETILQGATCVEDCFRAQAVSMQTAMATDDWVSGVNCGRRFLTDLGVSTPKKATTLNVVMLLFKTKRLLKGRPPRDLEKLPPMENLRMSQALFILGSSALCAYCKGDEALCTVWCLNMFLITLQYGISGDSPYAFAAYGMVMSAVGDFNAAYEYGRLAIDMLERPGMEKSIAKVQNVVHNHLAFLKDPIQASLDPLLAGYTAGMHIGDVTQAALCLTARARLGIFAGVPLVDHERYVSRRS